MRHRRIYETGGRKRTEEKGKSYLYKLKKLEAD
jgi:hypothetical protein